MQKTDLKSFIANIEKIVAQGNELQLIPALQQLATYLKPFADDEYRTTVLMISNINQLDNQLTSSRISRENYKVEVNQIRDNILRFIQRLPDKISLYQNLTVPVQAPVIEYKKEDFPKRDSNLEKIVGQNNLKSIAWLAHGLEMSKSVCRILVPVEQGMATGTGFLVGGELLFTNNHVIANLEEAQKAIIQFNFEESIEGKQLAPVEYKLSPESHFKTDQKLDFTVVKVNASSNAIPLSSFGTLEIDHLGVPQIREHVTIIQHPNGGLKQIALTANQVVNIYDHRLHYTTDTMPGSSGSPVFNDDWKVIALHHAGGNMEMNENGDSMFVNEAILFKDIYMHLGN